jgi:flagellar basal-body rod modification protein FlgD
MSSVSSLTSGSAVSGAVSSDTVSGSQQTLTQNDFLQLLVAQMENQDPMDPQSDTDMAAQMAQFTSLTQSSSMASSLSMMQANSLIGSTVTLQVDSQTTATGVVQGVTLENGTPQITVNNTSYTLSQVLSVTPPPAAQTSAASSTANPATN